MWKEWLATSKPVMPVLVIHNLDDAVPLAQALVAGGIKLLEVTLRTPAGLQAIDKISKHVPQAIVGAGTVTTEEQLRQVIDQGAQFSLSPGVTPSLLKAAQDWGGEFIPGVATASEVMQALEYGFTRQKCFPVTVLGGEALLAAWQGPFANVSFCPTGGLTQDNYQSLLALSNVFCVGGSWFIPKSLIQQKRWDDISQLAADIVA